MLSAPPALLATAVQELVEWLKHLGRTAVIVRAARLSRRPRRRVHVALALLMTRLLLHEAVVIEYELRDLPV